MKELKLIPPTDPRVQTAIAPFTDNMLKEHDFKDRKELTEAMFTCMNKFHGIGLTANQVGLPFNMFVAGGHPSIDGGKAIAMYNPVLLSVGVEELMMKEGCLTYPFLFLNIKRPITVNAVYEDDDGKEIRKEFSGLFSRIYQHEFDHTMGITFVEKVSKLKFDMAKKKAEKLYNRALKYAEIEKSRQA